MERTPEKRGTEKKRTSSEKRRMSSDKGRTPEKRPRKPSAESDEEEPTVPPLILLLEGRSERVGVEEEDANVGVKVASLEEMVVRQRAAMAHKFAAAKAAKQRFEEALVKREKGGLKVTRMKGAVKGADTKVALLQEANHRMMAHVAKMEEKLNAHLAAIEESEARLDDQLDAGLNEGLDLCSQLHALSLSMSWTSWVKQGPMLEEETEKAVARAKELQTELAGAVEERRLARLAVKDARSARSIPAPLARLVLHMAANYRRMSKKAAMEARLTKLNFQLSTGGSPFLPNDAHH